ncbi:MAG TPA: Ppx/GppA family phosphatase [Stellaceae bacterium]|jgi:exopolyphosphatase/guanosine-5'-triphosphate,3'-diphosphate pyrophosphatase
MPDWDTPAAKGRIGVIDLGSNSLRLVVFERLGEALFPLVNEKAMCGLARGISASGRLDRAGMGDALVNLRRFVALARAIGVDHLAVLATAAMRDASDGRTFADEVSRTCRVPVEIIDGAEEARLSAAGVLAGIPEADGIVADLGGGSVELVRLAAGATGDLGRIGRGITLPLGPLRLGALGDSSKAISEAVDRAFAAASVLPAPGGATLYLVGGAARAIARLHMEHTRYPLHIVHQYRLARAEAEAFFSLVGGLSRKSLERIISIPRKRLETVPVAALILRRLVAAMSPRRVEFSAFGLREGYAYSLMREAGSGGDPLIAACAAMARSQSRFPPDGARLQQWTAPLFPGLDGHRRRLHLATCWLGDIAWGEHPDYRAEQGFTRSLRMPLPAITHADRVFVAAALHWRYGGSADDPVRGPTRPLLDPGTAAEVRSLGLALRLAYTLCGGVIDLLAQARLGRDGGNLALEVPAAGGMFGGETVQRRLDAVARSMGVAALLVPRQPD